MAVERDIEQIAGDSCTIIIPLWTDAAATVPFDMEGYVARMMVRRNPMAPALLTLSTENGRIVETIDNDGRSILTITISPTDSRKLPVGSCPYDLEITNDHNWTRTILAGNVITTADITHD